MKRFTVKLSEIKERKGNIETDCIEVGSLGPITAMESAEKLTELLTRKLADSDAKDELADETVHSSDKGVR